MLTVDCFPPWLRMLRVAAESFQSSKLYQSVGRYSRKMRLAKSDWSGHLTLASWRAAQAASAVLVFPVAYLCLDGQQMIARVGASLEYL